MHKVVFTEKIVDKATRCVQYQVLLIMHRESIGEFYKKNDFDLVELVDSKNSIL